MKLFWSILTIVAVVGAVLVLFRVMSNKGFDPIGSIAGVFGGPSNGGGS